MKKPTSVKSKSKSKTNQKRRGFDLMAYKSQVYVSAVLGLGLITVLGAVYVANKSEPTHSAQGIVTLVRAEVGQRYDNVVPITSWSGEMSSGVDLFAEGYEFSVSSAVLPYVDFSLRDAAGPDDAFSSKSRIAYRETALDVVSERMAKEGYGVAKISGGEITYRKGSDACTFVAKDSGVSFSCYNDKTSAADAAATLDPFAQALFAKNPELRNFVSVGPLTIKSQNKDGVIFPTPVAGYDIAELVYKRSGDNDSDKRIALFYQKSGEPWQLVTTAGDEYGFPCADMMATPEIRKVMKGQVCLNENNFGQRRLDTKDSL